MKKKLRLSESAIMHHWDQAVLPLSLHVLDSVDSTNQYLLNQSFALPSGFSVCVSEQQTAGRGRHGRVWQSPACASIYLSVSSALQPELVSQLSRLPLYCGAALAEWLMKQGVAAQLKWPNDILCNGKKLAGLLVETRLNGQHGLVVMGLGFNVDMPPETMREVDQPWIDLNQCLQQTSCDTSHKLLDRNWLVAQLAAVLISAYGYWFEQNNDWFRAAWQQYDILQGRAVQVVAGQNEYSATVCGLADDGALLLQVGDEMRQVYAADVKLKINSC
jgi:BirA family biotin operon repressor/biotin-[acetyl-CoA-carboxylase] ligase